MEETYYCIKLISISQSKRGYVFQSKTKGINLAENFADYCLKFPTVKEAKNFIKDNKLEKNGFSSFIRSNSEIDVENERLKLKSGINRGCFKIINELGLNAFYDTKKQQYYFSKEEDGCASWHDKSSVRDYVTKMKSYFPDMVITARKLRTR